MDWQRLHITDGTGQQDRELPAFAPGYFEVDEHSFTDLLAMGASFASKVQFYDLDNETDGFWNELFDADEAVVMAKILRTDLARLESDFMKIPYSESARLLHFLLDLAHEINHWYLRLSASRHESGQMLAARLETIIRDKLAIQLHNLYLIGQYRGISLDSPEEHKPEEREFHRVWKLDPVDDADMLERSAIDPDTDGRGIKSQLRDLFNMSSNAISYLKTSADSLLQQSLQSKQHEPSIGLFIVFLQLYEKAQREINRFTLQHLDFYYRQVLKAGNKPPIPQSHYLVMKPLGGVEPTGIEKGAGFSAGQDAESNDIVYSADEELQVSDTRVEALATLYLQHDPLVSPESDLGFVTRIKSDLPAVFESDAATDENPYGSNSWPLFGADPARGAKGGSSDAGVGFSLASALLLLEQGERKIDITIELEPVDKIGFKQQLDNLWACTELTAFRKQFSRIFARYLLTQESGLQPWQKDKVITRARSLGLPKNAAQEIEKLLEMDWQWLFYKCFRESFRVDLTAEDCWLEVEDYYLQPLSQPGQGSKTGFRIGFALGQEAAPITAYNAELHGGQLQTDLPVMRCRINPQSYFFAYSIFRDLVIAALRIDVDVSDVKNLLVYNQHGQLDPSKPFQPFGPQPGSNSYFVFGNYELARKPLREMRIDLDWADLPQGLEGFEEHYRAYRTVRRNDSFKAGFSALVDGRWQAEDSAQKPHSLFASLSGSNRIAPHREIEIKDFDFARPLAAEITESAYRYDLKSRRGFYRLALAAPAAAFGHAEHGPLLTEILSTNAKRKILKPKPKPLPNPPYTPMLNGISLAYKASATIYPSRATAAPDVLPCGIFHQHPFGIETVYPPTPDAPCHLLPQYENEGNLYIGLSGSWPGGPLSLLFHLSKQQEQAINAGQREFEWFYLKANRWQKLKKYQVLADRTQGFQTSGSITLDIPGDISRGNSIMPGNYCWLRVSASRDASLFPSCFSVRPHAVKVSRRRRDPAIDAEPDPDWAAIPPLPGIGGIKSAYAPFGGRDGESDRQLRVRISERLRHKNRASIPWDYEQMILEEFPEIGKVKCFNSISSIEDGHKPGHVLIVVVPARPRVSESSAHEMIGAPKLKQIRDYVKKRCSTFAEIEVRNPQYEQVQVRCTVKLAEHASGGNSIKRLNREISDYICPWKPGGYGARFGWSIRQQDIESHIFGLDYIESVTDFSMLRITVDRDGKYSLFDTAKNESVQEAVIKPRYPWSLALPVEKHYIETMPTLETIKAKITGVNELEIGSTFIIVGSGENGEEE